MPENVPTLFSFNPCFDGSVARGGDVADVGEVSISRFQSLF